MCIFRPVGISFTNTATSTRQNISIGSYPNIMKYRDEGTLLLRIYNPGVVDIGVDFGFISTGGTIPAYLVIKAGSVEVISCPEGDWNWVSYLSSGANQEFYATWGTLIN